jgi:hypothetical protein
VSALRTQLEEAQARVKHLEVELRNFPAKSAEREALELLVADVQKKAADSERALAKLQLEQETLRAYFSESAWWRSWWLVVLASIAGTLGGIHAALWALDHLEWYLVAEPLGWCFVSAPLIINAARFALGRRKLARRRQLGG